MATASHATMDRLEPRRLFAAVYPTSYEQYMVELINRARANPGAEAARYSIALNEGVPAAQQISTAAKQPLAINPYITDAARKHSQWMVDNNVFSHTGQGGKDPGGRMTAAGYSFTGSWTWGENIAYRSGSLSTTLIGQIHKDLFVDIGITGRGHRTNMMNGNLREAGAGIIYGEVDGFNAAMVTTDFGKTGSSVFLTGVAYVDTISGDQFYTPGEGIAGATITATRTDGLAWTTTTWSSGGYSLAVPAGTYTVVASGGAFGQAVQFSNIAVGSSNVKRDFVPGQGEPPPGPADQELPTGALTYSKKLMGEARNYSFQVTFNDDIAINVSTLDNLDILVTGPKSFSKLATFVKVDKTTNGKPRVATYQVRGPGGRWDSTDNAFYNVILQAKQVADTNANKNISATLGKFLVKIPAPTASPAIAPKAAVFAIKRESWLASE